MNADFDASVDWRSTLNNLLPFLGYRNWIVAADSAYPAQSNPGIETSGTGVDHLELLNIALSAIGDRTHVRPKIYLDRELQYASEQDAQGLRTTANLWSACWWDGKANRFHTNRLFRNSMTAQGSFGR